jgi:hypothetical protein
MRTSSRAIKFFSIFGQACVLLAVVMGSYLAYGGLIKQKEGLQETVSKFQQFRTVVRIVNQTAGIPTDGPRWNNLENESDWKTEMKSDINELITGPQNIETKSQLAALNKQFAKDKLARTLAVEQLLVAEGPVPNNHEVIAWASGLALHLYVDQFTDSIRANSQGRGVVRNIIGLAFIVAFGMFLIGYAIGRKYERRGEA